jgi:hypothetical protein
MLPPDIEETILSSLQTMFTQALITAVPGDALALHVLKQGPLQDDPTAVAPYLVYTKDQDKGVQRMKHEDCKIYGDVEIGGPLRFLIYFNGICGTPLATTKEQAQKDVNNLMSRIMNALAANFDLSKVAGGVLQSQDTSRLIEGANPYYLFEDQVKTRVYGGESTWYGEGHVCWRYPISWYV